MLSLVVCVTSSGHVKDKGVWLLRSWYKLSHEKAVTGCHSHRHRSHELSLLYYILNLQNMFKRSRPMSLDQWMKFQSTSQSFHNPVHLLSWTSWELDKSTKLWSFCIPYGSALSILAVTCASLCLCHGCHHARTIQQSKQFRIVSKSVESSCKASSAFWGEKSLICDVTTAIRADHKGGFNDSNDSIVINIQLICLLMLCLDRQCFEFFLIL